MSQEPSMSLILLYESAVIDATSKEASLSIAAGGSTDHGLPYGFWCQHGSQPSTLSLVAARITANQQAFRWQPRPQMSAWPLAAMWIRSYLNHLFTLIFPIGYSLEMKKFSF